MLSTSGTPSSLRFYVNPFKEGLSVPETNVDYRLHCFYVNLFEKEVQVTLPNTDDHELLIASM